MTRRRPLSDEDVHALREAAKELPSGGRRRWAEERAEILGCHVTTIYRAIKPAVGRGRAKRSDAGTRRAIEEADFMDLAAMVTKHDYDAELAIDTLNANRVLEGLPALDIHPETFRRQLRDAAVSRRHNQVDLRVHRRWEAPYPGHTFQIDSTQSASYYIDNDDTIGYEAAVVKNKNKAGNQKPRVWLIAGIDDNSRTRWGRFYTGNDTHSWLDFMLRAWRGYHPDPNVWPAFGVPERVYTDQDSAMKSMVMTRALELLEVERVLANPSTEHWSNSQAKGKVERSIQVLQGFEKMTGWKRFSGLQEMNDHLLDYLIWLNNRPHSSTGESPFKRWLAAKQVTLLPPAEITRRMSYREDWRTITPELTIGLERKTYQLPRRAPFMDYVGQRVQVSYLTADLSRITVLLDGEEHEILAVEAVPDVAGDIKAAPVPASVALKKDLLERDLSHLDPHAVTAYRREKTEQLYPVRPATVPHPLSVASLAPRMIRRGRATDRVQAEGVVGVPPSELERAALDRLFSGRREIPEQELSDWISARRGERGGDTAVRAERA